MRDLNKRPLVAGIAMVKNEEDVIEQFVRHNLEYLNLLVILENGSVDNTAVILKALRQEGLPVVILDDPDPTYSQSEKMTRFMQNVAVTVFPGFILPLDVDEFIKCSSKDEFLAAINKIPSPGKGFVRYQTYIVPDKQTEAKPRDSLAQMNRRRRQERSETKKVILRLDGILPANISINMGNHDAIGLNEGIEVDAVRYAHFPVRTKSQLIEKTITGWMAYLLKNPRARYSREGYHWFELFEKIKNNEEINDRTLLKYSVCYAEEDYENWEQNIQEDPLRFEYKELKYTGHRNFNILGKLARTIEKNLAVEKNEFIEDLYSKLSELKSGQGNLPEKTSQCPEEIFDDNWHLDQVYLDIPPVKDLWEELRPSSVLDVGCGIGLYLKYLQSIGAGKITGIDGISKDVTLLNDGEYIQKNLNDGFSLNRKYELVLCLEVLEHINDKAARRVMNDISRHAEKFILFSAAEPGQPGHGHINCQPIKVWIDHWAELGWELMEFESLKFRLLASFTFLKRNPVLLVKKEHLGTPISGLIESIAKHEFVRWRQNPGIVTIPLEKSYYKNINRTLIDHLESKESASFERILVATIKPDKLNTFHNIDSIRKEKDTIFFKAVNNDPIMILPQLPIQNINIKLKIDLTVPGECRLQLFYLASQSTNYNEDLSVNLPVYEGRQTVFIKIPDAARTDRLRLDPGNIPGNYAIHSIEVWAENPLNS